MAGTIILTGANSSLAIPAVSYLLRKYPAYTAVLTVRDASESDVNTNALRAAIASFPKSKASIRPLDLSDFDAVDAFATSIAAEVAQGQLPKISSIVCNAFYWNLKTTAQQTKAGLDKTLQINYVSHAALILRLLGSFEPAGGRVVLLGSDTHETGKAPFEKIPPSLPDDLDKLNEPDKPTDTDKLGLGFWRYSVSKLAVIAFGYALNRHLEKDPKLSSITAVCIDPGALSDSRAFRTNTPMMMNLIQRLVMQPLRPILKLSNPNMRTTAAAGPDLIELATNTAHPGERGYFIHLNKATSSPESLDTSKQDKLWAKTLEWARITKDNTSLTIT